MRKLKKKITGQCLKNERKGNEKKSENVECKYVCVCIYTSVFDWWMIKIRIDGYPMKSFVVDTRKTWDTLKYTCGVLFQHVCIYTQREKLYLPISVSWDDEQICKFREKCAKVS